MMMEGRAHDVLKCLKAQYPQAFDQSEKGCVHRIEFLLLLQQFLELIHQSQFEPSVYFAREHLAPIHFRLDEQDLTLLKDSMSLIAYPNPEHSPVGHLLSPRQRQVVANEVNRFILEHGGCQTKSSLELVFAQTSLCCKYLRSLNCGGEKFVL
eukprot:c7495_g1_i5.p1 GENE.c7495_g1_i5~~c7495_g1_i5.p1  ORF type:complete len:153 (+),score=26.16 c7495_g1_i5:76-534(+)